MRLAPLACLAAGCAALPPGAEREIEAGLVAGGRYRIEAAMTPAPCTVTLVRENP